MESIDKLREYAAAKCGWGVSPEVARHIKKFADAIEREVEQLRDREYQNGREDAEGAVEFADRLCRASERREDVTLWGVDYMPLPVDADGEAIHVGDVLDPPADCDDYVPMQVMRLMYDGYEQEWFFDGQAGGFCGLAGERMDVAGWTHHHAPTVEDVLREFAEKIIDSQVPGVHPTYEEAIAEYAAKLALRGDE